MNYWDMPPEELSRVWRRIRDDAKEFGRLRGLSNTELVNEVMALDAAEDLRIQEMMTRLHPTWFEPDVTLQPVASTPARSDAPEVSPASASPPGQSPEASGPSTAPGSS